MAISAHSSASGKLKTCYDRGMTHRKRLIETSFNVLVAASQAFIAVVAGVAFAFVLWS
jgi:hypothetical protein